MGPLLEQVGGGKESLSFMKRRIRRLGPQWASAARRLDDRLRHLVREQKRVSVDPLTRSSILLFTNHSIIHLSILPSVRPRIDSSPHLTIHLSNHSSIHCSN